MKVQHLIYVIVPAVLVLFACAKTGDKSEPAMERLTPQVTETNLSASAQLVLDSYRNNQPLDAGKLRDAIYSNHLPIYEKTPAAVLMKNEDLESFYMDLGKGAISSDFVNFKSYYEQKLAAIFKADVDYDRSAVTLPHLKETNALQCYSGTMLYAVEALAHLNSDTRKHLVVIIESGHMLMGFVQQANDKQWYLTGIETTAGDKALIYYGPMKHVAKHVRVVDLELFLLIDSIKYALKNSMEVSNQALRITGSMYGASEVFLLNAEPSISAAANYTPFQFGAVVVPQGRTKRVTFEQINRSDLPRFVPGLKQLPQEIRDEERPGVGLLNPYEGGQFLRFAQREPLIVRIGALEQEVLSNPALDVVIDKNYFGASDWNAMTTVSQACEKYMKVMQEPGELSREMEIKIQDFLEVYSPKPTGERNSSRVDGEYYPR